MTNQTIWMVRHGNRLDFVYPEWFNTAKRRYDPPLSTDGFIQAKLLANCLKNEKIKHIFVSPFLRTIQTAYPLAEILNLSLKIERGLSEWLNQDWMTEIPQTEPKHELQKKYPLIDWHYQSLVIPEYPETEIQVKKRTKNTIKKLTKNYQENMLLVGHSASVLGCSLGLLPENIEIKTPLCGLIKIMKNQEKWALKLNGDISHISR